MLNRPPAKIVVAIATGTVLGITALANAELGATVTAALALVGLAMVLGAGWILGASLEHAIADAEARGEHLYRQLERAIAAQPFGGPPLSTTSKSAWGGFPIDVDPTLPPGCVRVKSGRTSAVSPEAADWITAGRIDPGSIDPGPLLDAAAGLRGELRYEDDRRG